MVGSFRQTNKAAGVLLPSKERASRWRCKLQTSGKSARGKPPVGKKMVHACRASENPPAAPHQGRARNGLLRNAEMPGDEKSHRWAAGLRWLVHGRCRCALIWCQNPVACIAQARQDVAVVVQLAVDGGGEDGHVGVGLCSVATPSGAASRQTNLMDRGLSS